MMPARRTYAGAPNLCHFSTDDRTGVQCEISVATKMTLPPGRRRCDRPLADCVSGIVRPGVRWHAAALLSNLSIYKNGRHDKCGRA
ncbi:MAG: hypothetical protein JWR80_6637 [Bradyrhizobium sp.]|nr:hypothetical protein [Bradyrhizobium sp.]